jgi:hypothetical protein
VDSCSAPDVRGEGGNQSATGTAVDAAGNLASATVSGIDIDKTAPTLTGTATTSPNGNGWYAGDVTVDWSCSDALSGIDGICPADSVVTGEGSNLSVSASVADRAGNDTNTTVSGIKIDRTAPSTTASVPDPLASGWYAGSVPVTLYAVDTLSHVDTTYYSVGGGTPEAYSGPFSFNEPGIHEITFWSIDNAGNLEDSGADGHTITLQIDNLAPSISGSRYPAPNAAGWNNGPVTVSFLCDDAESGIATCPDPTTVSTEGIGQSVTGTAIDNAGNSNSDTVSGIKIDLTSPVTTATLSPTAAWSNGDVQVSLSAVDPLSDVASTYHTIDGGSADFAQTFTVSGEGVHSLTFWSTDKADNSETPHTVSVKIDTSAPSIGHTLDPEPNGAGWNNSNVTVTFSCDDQEGLSGIASCTSPQTVSTEGAGQTITGHAVDHAGNTASDSATVNLDKTKPTISGAADRAANGNGWYKADVTVSFTCDDDRSGIASCSTPTTLGQGAGQSVTGHATDVAGNTDSDTVSGISIDKTAPTLSGAPTTSPNGAGWYNGDVTIQWTCSDALSGIAGSCPANSTITGEGSGQIDTASVSDKAGNSTDAISAPAINIDRTAPTTSASKTPAAIWANGDVLVSFSASDNLSNVANTWYHVDGGTAQSGAAVTVSAQGAHTVTFWSVDNAGNVETTKSIGVNVDLSAPTISGAPTTSPNGAGWYHGPVTVHFTCADQPGLSGTDSCGPDKTLSTEGAGQSVVGEAVDEAGNSASTTVSGINIDLAGPSLAVTGIANGGVYTLGAVPPAACSATDGTSGLATPCSLTVTGGTTNGVGTFAFTARATDVAGNTATVTGTYRVIYRWDGFLQPINDTAHQIGTATSVFKAGSTVPVKFQLKRADGTIVQANGLPAWLTPAKGASTTAAVDEAAYGDAATSGSTYRWDSSGSQYIYNWGTAKNQANFYWRIGVTLDDGQTYTVNIGLR